MNIHNNTPFKHQVMNLKNNNNNNNNNNNKTEILAEVANLG